MGAGVECPIHLVLFAYFYPPCTHNGRHNFRFESGVAELAKESPDSWKRIKEQLLEQQGE